MRAQTGSVRSAVGLRFAAELGVWVTSVILKSRQRGAIGTMPERNIGDRSQFQNRHQRKRMVERPWKSGVVLTQQRSVSATLHAWATHPRGSERIFRDPVVLQCPDIPIVERFLERNPSKCICVRSENPFAVPKTRAVVVRHGTAGGEYVWQPFSLSL